MEKLYQPGKSHVWSAQRNIRIENDGTECVNNGIVNVNDVTSMKEQSSTELVIHLKVTPPEFRLISHCHQHQNHYHLL